MFQGVLFSTLPNQMLVLFVYTFLPILTAGPYPQGIEETIEMCIYVNVELVFKGWRSLNNIFEYEINKQKNNSFKDWHNYNCYTALQWLLVLHLYVCICQAQTSFFDL